MRLLSNEKTWAVRLVVHRKTATLMSVTTTPAVNEQVASLKTECSDSCPALDDTQCDGTVIETCATGTDGCLDWAAGTDCSVADDYCNDSGASAVCGTCVDGCATADDTQCNGVVIETCTADADGCLDWAAGTDCSVADDYCDDSGASAVCETCIDTCTTAGDTQCSGDVIDTCTADVDGCLDWVAGTDCATAVADEVCAVLEDVATCALPTLTINELVYDDPGSDDNQFVELHYNLGALDLTGYTLVHYDGSSGGDIWAIDLSTYSIAADGLFVIGSANIAEADLLFTDAGESDAPLTRGPDGVVLYLDYGLATQTVIDAIAYEGLGNLPVEAIEGAASEGTDDGDDATSIGRFPDGEDTDDNSIDVQQMWFATPGLPNLPFEPDGYDRASGFDEATFPVDIPDDGTPLNVTININGGASWFPDVLTNFHVGLWIEHPNSGDLDITLTSPDGTVVILWINDVTGLTDDIVTVFDLETDPDDPVLSMDDFDGESGRGVWTLTIVDATAGDPGRVVDWFIVGI